MIHKSMLSELVCWDNHNCLDIYAVVDHLGHPNHLKQLK